MSLSDIWNWLINADLLVGLGIVAGLFGIGFLVVGVAYFCLWIRGVIDPEWNEQIISKRTVKDPRWENIR